MKHIELLTTFTEASQDQAAAAFPGTLETRGMKLRAWGDVWAQQNLLTPEQGKAMRALGETLQYMKNTRNPERRAQDYAAWLIQFNDFVATVLPQSLPVEEPAEVEAVVEVAVESNSGFAGILNATRFSAIAPQQVGITETEFEAQRLTRLADFAAKENDEEWQRRALAAFQAEHTPPVLMKVLSDARGGHISPERVDSMRSGKWAYLVEEVSVNGSSRWLLTESGHAIMWAWMS